MESRVFNTFLRSIHLMSYENRSKTKTNKTVQYHRYPSENVAFFHGLGFKDTRSRCGLREEVITRAWRVLGEAGARASSVTDEDQHNEVLHTDYLYTA